MFLPNWNHPSIKLNWHTLNDVWQFPIHFHKSKQYNNWFFCAVKTNSNQSNRFQPIQTQNVTKRKFIIHRDQTEAFFPSSLPLPRLGSREFHCCRQSGLLLWRGNLQDKGSVNEWYTIKKTQEHNKHRFLVIEDQLLSPSLFWDSESLWANLLQWSCKCHFPHRLHKNHERSFEPFKSLPYHFKHSFIILFI